MNRGWLDPLWTQPPNYLAMCLGLSILTLPGSAMADQPGQETALALRSLHDERLDSVRGAGGSAPPGTCPPRVRYYHHDATGNLWAMTDESSVVVWRAEVHPFGQGVATPPDRPLRLLDQPRDERIGVLGGIYQVGVRYLDPVTGRFLTADPISLTSIRLDQPQRFNRFIYGLNNPYRYIDPSGGEPEEASRLNQLASGAWDLVKNAVNKVVSKVKSVPLGPLTLSTDINEQGNVELEAALGKSVDFEIESMSGSVEGKAATVIEVDPDRDELRFGRLKVYVAAALNAAVDAFGIEEEISVELFRWSTDWTIHPGFELRENYGRRERKFDEEGGSYKMIQGHVLKKD